MYRTVCYFQFRLSCPSLHVNGAWILFLRQTRVQSSFLLAVPALVAPSRLVGGVSLDPVIRREATENLFANGSESSGGSSHGFGAPQTAFYFIWWCFFTRICAHFRGFLCFFPTMFPFRAPPRPFLISLLALDSSQRSMGMFFSDMSWSLFFQMCSARILSGLKSVQKNTRQ